MESRCSPCNRTLFFSVLGVLFLCGQVLHAQCKSDFSYQFTSAESSSNSGKIELSFNGPDAGTYIINLYKMEGKAIPVATRESSSLQKIVFERLAPSRYYIKIEWGPGCRKILGGLEGIVITEKDQRR